MCDVASEPLPMALLLPGHLRLCSRFGTFAPGTAVPWQVAQCIAFGRRDGIAFGTFAPGIVVPRLNHHVVVLPSEPLPQALLFPGAIIT